MCAGSQSRGKARDMGREKCLVWSQPPCFMNCSFHFLRTFIPGEKIISLSAGIFERGILSFNPPTHSGYGGLSHEITGISLFLLKITSFHRDTHQPDLRSTAQLFALTPHGAAHIVCPWNCRERVHLSKPEAALRPLMEPSMRHDSSELPGTVSWRRLRSR